MRCVLDFDCCVIEQWAAAQRHLARTPDGGRLSYVLGKVQFVCLYAMNTHTYAQKKLHAHTRTYIHTQTYKHTYTHTHTRTHARSTTDRCQRTYDSRPMKTHAYTHGHEPIPIHICAHNYTIIHDCIHALRTHTKNRS